MKRIPDKTIVEIYGKKGCNVTATCAALGISRRAFYDWKKKRAKLAEKLEEVEEGILDFAESKLIEHIQNDDVQSLMFFLRTKGKKRGYVEKTENEVSINAFERLMQETEDE